MTKIFPLNAARDFYQCWVEFFKTPGGVTIYIYDKRFSDEPLFAVAIGNDEAEIERHTEAVRETLRGPDWNGFFYGGQTREDIEHQKETGEVPLGAELPPGPYEEI